MALPSGMCTHDQRFCLISQVLPYVSSVIDLVAVQRLFIFEIALIKLNLFYGARVTANSLY
jgi:hypothetical protein